MPLNIGLDTGQDLTNVNQQKDPNTEINQIKENEHIQADLAKLDLSQKVNVELAEEVLSTLREIEGNLYSYDGDNNRFINWETDRIPYDALRRAGESEPARLIKNKRRLDFMVWGNPPSQSSIERGAKLAFTNPDYVPSKQEKALLREWEQRIFSKLFFPANDPLPNFGKFIGNAYEDFFDLDDITIEIRKDGFGQPVAIHLQDPIIYKPVVKESRFNTFLSQDAELTALLEDYERLYGEKINVNKPNTQPDYLLIYKDQKVAGATREVVRKFHFFTRSMFQKAQRGYSITEQAVRMITYITNALKMNASNFINNRLPQGFFAFTNAGVNQTQLDKLKKILSAYGSGSDNQNKFPMISLTGERADAKWIGTRGHSRDMEYHQFMTLLFSIFCMLSGTDPRELSLGSYGDAVGRSSLFEEPTDGVRKESKDTGLKTFLYYLGDSLNSPNQYGQNIFQQITKLDCRLRFVGFEVEDKQKKIEIQTKELASTKSINDLLAEQDVESQELKLGDANIYDVKGLGSPQVFQTLLFNAQQKAQQNSQMMQPSMQGSPEGAPAGAENQIIEEPDNKSQQGENGLTDKDRELLDKYRGQADIDPALLSQIGAS